MKKTGDSVRSSEAAGGHVAHAQTVFQIYFCREIPIDLIHFLFFLGVGFSGGCSCVPMYILCVCVCVLVYLFLYDGNIDILCSFSTGRRDGRCNSSTY